MVFRTGVTKMDFAHDIPPALTPKKKPCQTPPAAKVTPSPTRRLDSSSCNLSFQEASPSPRGRRKSLRRSVKKKYRRTLPPIYNNATVLSNAISLSMPEDARLMELINACFQYSVGRLENSLSHIEGFHTKSFSAKVSSVKQKIARYTERLAHDGTLKRCIEGSNSLPNNEDVKDFQAKVNSDISVMTAECQQWEQLLEDYKKKEDEEIRQLKEIKEFNNQSESYGPLQASQETVLQSKPDYKAMLNQQGAVFDNMEITLDEIRQSVQLIDSFSSDTASHLQQLSSQLKSKSFKPMEDSPVRTFLRVFKNRN